MEYHQVSRRPWKLAENSMDQGAVSFRIPLRRGSTFQKNFCNSWNFYLFYKRKEFEVENPVRLPAVNLVPFVDLRAWNLQWYVPQPYGAQLTARLGIDTFVNLFYFFKNINFGHLPFKYVLIMLEILWYQDNTKRNQNWYLPKERKALFSKNAQARISELFASVSQF